jgi:hypothetical protein
MNPEPQKSNTVLIVIAIIGVIGTVIGTIITVMGNYNVEKLRQETELTRIALVSIATQSGATQTVLQSTINAPTELPVPSTTPSQNRIDAISGTWVGKAKNGNFEFDAKFVIEESCKIGSVCGTFDFPTISCSGTITITKIDGTLFISQPNDRTSGCFTTPDIQESFQLLPDGTLIYTSTSNSYGETRAVLSKQK